MKIRISCFIKDAKKNGTIFHPDMKPGVFVTQEVEYPQEDCEEKPVQVMDTMLGVAHKLIDDNVDFVYEVID